MNRHLKHIITAMLVTAFVVIFSTNNNVYAAGKGGAAKSNAVPKASEVSADAMHLYVSELINTITKPEQTQDQKLAACYHYCLAHMKYKRDLNPGSSAKVKDYALEAFFTGRGNCYRYASMFAYMASELGYNVKIQSGQCTSDKGGWTPHSWCAITHDNGNVLIYDLSFGDANFGKKNYYGITPAEHARALLVQEEWFVTF